MNSKIKCLISVLTDVYLPLFWVSIFWSCICIPISALELSKNLLSDEPKNLNIMLMGDSISRGFAPQLTKLLPDHISAFQAPSHPTNTEDPAAINNFQYINKELESRAWDFIYFNWGFPALWLKEKGLNRVPLEEYGYHLQVLVDKLRETNSTLVWITTTYVPPGIVNPNPQDILKYNFIASRVMTKNGIAVLDLYSYSKMHHLDIQISNNIHFTNSGHKALAEQIFLHIKSIVDLRN